jgi:L-seryl-tRNA(Ser) seleniumtransferase
MGKKAKNSVSDPRRNLPSVAALLEEKAIEAMIAEHTRPIVLDAINDALAWFRKNLKSGEAAPEVSDVIAKVESFLLAQERDSLRPVVNATGIILHTGLGRAVLPQRAVDALAGLNRCCNLQMDMETCARGKRNYMTEYLLAKLTGAEAAMVVNNNAAATLLILTALCEGKEVIVSRGQLIEIGGSFRLPDCIHQSGAIMVEVGTTNKTHLRDYERALSENTGAILRVNPSNYRVIGFAEQVPIADLVTLKKKQPVLVIDDLGCGALVNLEEYGLPHEPTAPDSIAAGADVVCFSGDKLIGGPQAGIIVGKKELIDKIKKHPLTRMLRVCKLTDLAMEQTLRLFLEPDTLLENNPTLRMLTVPADMLKKKAAKLKKNIEKEKLAIEARVAEGESATGGGSLPGVPIKTYVVALTSKLSADRLSHLLRRNEPPIIARIADDEVLLDMRTLLDGEEDLIVQALKGIANS